MTPETTTVSRETAERIDVHLVSLESLAERLHRAGQHVWGHEVDQAVAGIKAAVKP